VGDSADSYAYDGARVKRWTNTRPAPYGQHWLPGDVIGVCIDLPFLPTSPENNEDLSLKKAEAVVTGLLPGQESQDGSALVDVQDEEASEKHGDEDDEDDHSEEEEEEEEQLFGTISFYRNGQPLGPAFPKVRTGTGLAYFPTISLSHREKSLLNFGAKPFHFPVPGYHALSLIVLSASELRSNKTVLCVCGAVDSSRFNSHRLRLGSRRLTTFSNV
jgi:hypothetical protein